MDFKDVLMAEVIAMYGKRAGSETARPEYLPDRDEVTDIIKLLRRLLFPGYFDDTGFADSRYALCGVMSEVEYKLQRQICRALNLHACEGCGEGRCTDMFDRAGEISRVFLKKIPGLLDVLLTDVRATYDGDPAASSEHEVIFAYPGVFAISIYRLAHELYRLSVPLIPRIMTEYAHGKTGIDIHPGADIGRYFCIDHGTGIVIGETTKIGENVKLYQGVTLGALSTRGGQGLRGQKRHPSLEDEVTVYSGASILGGDTVIGKGSVIGGNVFITKSVPPNTRVSLSPPKLDYIARANRQNLSD